MTAMDDLRVSIGMLRREDLDTLQRAAESALHIRTPLFSLETIREAQEAEEALRRQERRNNARPPDAVEREGRGRLFLPCRHGRPYRRPGESEM